MHRKRPYASPTLLVIGLVLTAMALGCSSRSDLPPLAPASGIVTLDGNPSVGVIGPEGRFTMFTADENGAVLGFHKVRVEAREEVDLNEASWSPSLIDERYNDPNASGLTAEVKQGRNDEIHLKLTSKPGSP